MQSSIPELHYERMRPDTLSLACAIQAQVWPNDIHPEDLSCKLEHPDDESNCTWLVYFNQTLVGFIGIFTFDEDEPGYDNGESIWLDWFAILPAYRRRGWGKTVLIDAINYCRDLKQYQYLRLDTEYWPNRPALFLYDKIMDLREVYTAEDTPNHTYNRLIYSRCLDGSPMKPWQNRFLNLNRS